MKKSLFISFLVILVVSLMLAGCASPSAPTTTAAAAPTTSTTPATANPAAKDGGVLRIIATESPSGSIGIPENLSGMSSNYIPMMIEPLIQVSTSGQVVYKLATGYEWSNNYKTITLTLRKNVKFHDGTAWNTAALDWNIQQRITAKVDGTENIESTKVLDDYTYQINLKAFQNTWFSKLGATMGFMISPTWLQQKGVDYVNWHPVGTGPFKFVNYKENELMSTERFDGYWGDRPHLDGINYVFIADPVTAQIAFESGEGDVISVMTGGQKLANELVPKGYVAELAEGTCYTLIPSSGQPNSPFSNLKVRQAVDYAINKEKIAQSIGKGYWTPMYQGLGSAGTPYDDPSFQEQKYNPDKAKQLLTEAGYPSGFKTTLYWGQHLAGDEVPAIQADLLAVGIDAKIELVSVAKWIEMETNGWADGLEGSWVNVNFNLGTVLLRYWIKPLQPNWARGLYWNTLYRPDEMEKLIQEYLVIPDTAGQVAKGKEIAKVWHDQAVAIPIIQSRNITILQPYVKDRKTGIIINNSWSFTGTWLDK